MLSKRGVSLRNRQSGGYLAFVILILIINVAPAIYRALIQNPEGSVRVFSDVGDLTKYLGGGAIIAVVLYFVWAQISPGARSIDNDEDEIEASRKQRLE